MAAYDGNAGRKGGDMNNNPDGIPQPGVPLVLLLGASHIRRLSEFCAEENIQNFNVDNQRAVVESYGIGGMRIIVDHDEPEHVQAKAFRNHCGYINLVHPEVVILQIGSNDISRTCNSIDRCAFAIYATACYSVMAGAGMVILLQQFPRSQESYNDRARAVNQLVEQMVAEGVADGSYPNIEFWRHAGLQYPEIDIHDPYGVHLNIMGNYRFYRSVRGAILYSTR